jgi:hypothetical protein
LAKVKAGKLTADKVLSEPLYTMMWKRDEDGSMQISQSDLDEHYVLKACLPRYSLIELHLGERSCLCYTGGATTGKIEVYSVVGDNFDLQTAQIVGSAVTRDLITVSTITSLKLRSISVLGRLS